MKKKMKQNKTHLNAKTLRKSQEIFTVKNRRKKSETFLKDF